MQSLLKSSIEISSFKQFDIFLQISDYAKNSDIFALSVTEIVIPVLFAILDPFSEAKNKTLTTRNT
jgi:hypothetical protein